MCAATHHMQSLRISDAAVTHPSPMIKLDATTGSATIRGFKGSLRKQSECMSIDSGVNRTKNSDRQRMALTNQWQKTNKYMQYGVVQKTTATNSPGK